MIMIQYAAVVFWTSESNFEKVKTMLRSEFGLVPPLIADEERLRRQLVWEDSSKVGRWRVNFSPGQRYYRCDHPKTGEKRMFKREGFTAGPNMLFRYWSQRLDDITTEKDPMKAAYLRTYEILKPVKATDGNSCQDINLEELLR